jgi:phage-related protein
MGIRHELNTVIDKVKETVDNVKDAASESTHRAAANADQQKRDVAGDAMTVSEKAGSVIDQVKNTVQGDIDAAKRDSRSKA